MAAGHVAPLRVAVVGAGVSGLSFARRLLELASSTAAARDAHVTLFEAVRGCAADALCYVDVCVIVHAHVRARVRGSDANSQCKHGMRCLGHAV